MNAEKTFTSGQEPFVQVSYGRYYTDEAGNVTDKAPEGKYERGCKVLVQVGIPADMPEEVKAAAIEHSMTRKAQESIQAEGRKDTPDFQAFADNFVKAYYANMLNEKAERAAKVVDTITGAVISQLVLTLKDKIAKAWDFSTAKVAIPGADSPPLDKAGKINFRAWAKMIPADHPWFIKIKGQIERAADKMD